MSEISPKLVLAAASSARAQLLKQAGIPFLRDPAAMVAGPPFAGFT